MVTEFFLGLATGIADWFLGLFGDDPLPTWMTQVGPMITELWLRVEGLGAWVPLGLLGAVSVGLLGWWGLFWIVKGVRWLWGLTPFSGGS